MAITLFLIAAAASSCSHGRRQGRASPSEAPPPADATHLEIQYMLGHTARKLKMESLDDKSVLAETFHENVTLKKRTIDQSRYLQFRTQVSDFIAKRREQDRNPSGAHPPNCRSPYTIVLRNTNDIVKFKGCRGSDDGAFGRLVKDGEFLIYSQK